MSEYTEEEVKRYLIARNQPCLGGCRHEPQSPPHDCPYNEIGGDVICTCCDNCAYSCAMDI